MEIVLKNPFLNTHSGKVPPCLKILNGIGIYANWWVHKENHKMLIFYPIETIFIVNELPPRTYHYIIYFETITMQKRVGRSEKEYLKIIFFEEPKM